MVNKARGEVEAEFGGEKFVFLATLDRVAKLTDTVKIADYQKLLSALSFVKDDDDNLTATPNPKVLMQTLQTLCVSGNEDKLADCILGFGGLVSASTVAISALMGNVSLDDDGEGDGIVEGEDDKKKPAPDEARPSKKSHGEDGKP